MNLLEAKFLTMSVLGLVSIVLGLLPRMIIKKLGLTMSSTGDVMSSFTRTALSGILCFGGGVLMGTGFLHLLPEVHEGWQRYTKENDIDVNLPLGIVVICAGFFLVYFVEELAHLMADRHAHNITDVSIHRAVSIRGCPVSLEGPAPPCESSGCQKADSEASCQDSTICQLDCDVKEFCRDVTEGGECSSKKCSPAEGTCTPIRHLETIERNDGYGTFGTVDSQKNRAKGDLEHVAENHMVNCNLHCGNQKSKVLHCTIEGDDSSQKRSLSSGQQSHDLHHHHGLMMENGHCVGAPLRGLLFIIALSLHEILEGVAVGLQKNQSGVLQLFAAVASHKFVISFCVGLEFSTSGIRLLRHIIYILVFSLVTPLGIGIGIFMTVASSSEENLDDSLSSLIMQGLACGTILYVAFFEILERERSKSTVGLIQWMLLVFGFCAIMGLQLLAVDPDFELDRSKSNVTIQET